MKRIRLKPQRKLFAIVNKNLLNFPVARSRMMKSWDWKPAKDRWVIGTPQRDIGFTLELPPGTPRKYWRCPTGFEVNVLLFMMVEAKFADSDTIILPSLAHTLHQMQIDCDSYNRSRLRDALTYWSKINIVFVRFYHAVAAKDRERRYKRSDPTPYERREHVLTPIISVDASTTPIRIKMDRRFLALSTRYFRHVPLPLPNDEAAQNIVLCLLAGVRRTDIDDLPHLKAQHARRISEFKRKVGIAKHGRSAEVFKRALYTAKDWFETRMRLNLDWLLTEDGKGIVFWTSAAVTNERRTARVMPIERHKTDRVNVGSLDEIDRVNVGRRTG